MIIYRPYSDHEMGPFYVLMADYWKETEGEKARDYIEIDMDSGPAVTNDLQLKLYSYLNEGAKIMLAYKDGELIGFMIYHKVFDCILICRAIYLKANFRRAGYLNGLIHSVGEVKRVFSQTYCDREPEEIRGEKPNRKLVKSDGKINVWENILRK